MDRGGQGQVMEDLITRFLLRLNFLITTHTERLTHKKKASSGNLRERMLDELIDNMV